MEAFVGWIKLNESVTLSHSDKFKLIRGHCWLSLFFIMHHRNQFWLHWDSDWAAAGVEVQVEHDAFLFFFFPLYDAFVFLYSLFCCVLCVSAGDNWTVFFVHSLEAFIALKAAWRHKNTYTTDLPTKNSALLISVACFTADNHSVLEDIIALLIFSV